MYNEEQKNRYLAIRESKGLPIEPVKRTFKVCDEFQIKLGKDLYDFTFVEIKDMYKTLNGRTIQSLRNRNSSLKLYTEWALSENLVKDRINHYSEMTTKDYEDCMNIVAINNRYLSKEDVYNILDLIVNPCDQFYLLALYEGLGEGYNEDIVKLTLSDFDEDNLTVKIGNNTRKISKKLYYIAEEAANTYYYVSSDERRIKMVGEKEDTIIKDRGVVLQPHLRVRKMNVRFIKIFKLAGIEDWISFSAISDSGKVNWIKEQMETYGYTLQEFYDENITTDSAIKARKLYNQTWTRPLTPAWYERCKQYF